MAWTPSTTLGRGERENAPKASGRKISPKVLGAVSLLTLAVLYKIVIRDVSSISIKTIDSDVPFPTDVPALVTQTTVVNLDAEAEQIVVDFGASLTPTPVPPLSCPDGKILHIVQRDQAGYGICRSYGWPEGRLKECTEGFSRADGIEVNPGDLHANDPLCIHNP